MSLDWSKLNLIFRKPNKRYPSIPTVDDSIQSHTSALRQIKEGMEIGERRAGDIRDSFVRVGELEDILDNLFSGPQDSGGWPGFATRLETDQGVIRTKALNPDVGAYAYDRYRYWGQHAAGKGTEAREILSDGSNVTPNCRESNVFYITMLADIPVMNAPTNPINGQVMNFYFIQGAGAPWAVTAWDPVWWFVNRALPYFSRTEGKVDLISCQYSERLGKWLCAFQRDYGADGLGQDLLFDVTNVGAGSQIYKDTIDILGTTTARLRSILCEAPLVVTQNADTLSFHIETSTAPNTGDYLAWTGTEWDALVPPAIPQTIEDLLETNIPYKNPGDALIWDGYNWIADAVTGASSLDGLTDVVITGASLNEVLKYNGSEWVNAAAPGGASAMDDLTDVRAPSPAAGDYLQWNGYEWANHPIPTGSVTVDKTTGLQFQQGWPLYVDGTPAVDLSYDSATRKVTITAKGGASEIVVFVNGVAHTETSPFVSTAHDATQGNHFFYWDGGDWIWSDAAWDIMTTAPTALVYWDTTTGEGVLFKETHTTSRDPAIHRRLHEIEGTALVSGGVLSGYTLETDSDAGVSFAVSAATIADEDLHTTTAAQTDAGTYYIWYRTGASGDWTYVTQAGYAWTKGTNYPKINTFVASSWGLNELSNNSYGTFYVVATPAITTGHGIVVIPGQTQHSTLAAANAEVFADLARGSDAMPFQEFVVLAKVVVYALSSHGGTTKVKIKSVTSYSGTRTASISTSSATNHNALSGLQGGTAAQYYHMTAAEYTAFQASVTPTRTLGATWGSGSALVATSCADVIVHVPQTGTITGVYVYTQGGTGSCVIDVWNDTYANYPPTVADTITASAKPTISSGVKYSDTTLTGWDKALTAGDVLKFHVDSTSTFTNINVVLTYQ